MGAAISVPLYHDDQYRRSARARIILSGDDTRGPYVVLNETIFYPQGGGQKGDRGVLRSSDDVVVSVVDTRKSDGEILHYLDPRDPAGQGGPVQALIDTDLEQHIDWAFRYHQMKLHSAAHFLHCALEQVTGAQLPYPIRAPLSETHGECHYEFADKFDESGLAEATAMMNTKIAEGHEITTQPEEARGPGFRSWQCEGYYISCGGLHPANSREIGPVAASMRRKRGKTLLSFWLAEGSSWSPEGSSDAS